MTHAGEAIRSTDEIAFGAVRLEELVDRAALTEMLESFHALFEVPIRVFSAEGKLLAEVAPPLEMYTYLGHFRPAREAVQQVVQAVKHRSLEAGGEAAERCVTGARYRVLSITYDSRELGRAILGPFVPAELAQPPEALAALDPGLDPVELARLFAAMPHARDERIAAAARHLLRTLDLILFSGHKALLTSNMHLASVRESYRELEDKNAKLQEAFDRLKELDRLKSNFLATVSHELRTPLTSIIGYSEMLYEGIAGEMPNEQREFVGTIREKGEQLLELIKGLLDLSKLESGTMSLTKANLDVGPIVADVAQTLTPTARKKGVSLAVSVDEALPRLWADAARLRQVLLNLTENAIKFTPAGGVVTLSARVTLMSAARGDDDGGGMVLLQSRRPAIELRVADTGIGIPPEERGRVFDAFYQVDSSSTREAGGTGLGLSIVKRLVEGHDGTVSITDNQPRGAVFVVSIPCRRATIS
ncbi:MAG: ATP-binding protein [Sorangiineae bacterium]|nr:ATP-binding protein [Polyangiaceae bacterium]MEB2322508.1 ATP-binding protein [Sorangiineae bacterium]